MHVLKSTKGGFTLIEVSMVLAISALLAIILFSMYGQTRQRAQFTDAIERVVTNLERSKTEANSSYTTGPGLNQSRSFFARAVTFDDPDQFSYSMSTLTTNRVETSSTPSALAKESDIRTEVLAWGTACTQNCQNAVVFSRDLSNGNLNTFIVNKNQLLSDSIYVSGSSNDTSTLNLEFTSPQGYRATVTVNAQTGEIKRSYNY